MVRCREPHAQPGQGQGRRPRSEEVLPGSQGALEITGRFLPACATVLAAAWLCGAAPASAEPPSDSQFYAWLCERQNPKTGLVPSYTGDPMLAGVAITYDQALAAFTFLAHGDTERARRVIAFFERADRSENLYNTAYDSETGTTWEYNLSVGPNAWIALAMLRVADATKSRPMQSMAAVIGDTLARMQDAEGGIKGGPSVEWYSVEHQLDVYALFGALHKATGAQVYAKARERTFEWIKHYGFDASQTHIRRGKNDNTLACDVYTWSVAALGPQKLGEAGMDARAVMQKAEDLCYVTDSAVKGFDFTDAGKIGRRPVVSSEWTAQAALSWSILGDGERAARYLEGILPMASGGALPYASAAGADTGHGWKTPQGEATGSVAGTAYYLLARRGVNPLDPDARLPRAENVGK